MTNLTGGFSWLEAWWNHLTILFFTYLVKYIEPFLNDKSLKSGVGLLQEKAVLYSNNMLKQFYSWFM